MNVSPDIEKSAVGSDLDVLMTDLFCRVDNEHPL